MRTRGSSNSSRESIKSHASSFSSPNRSLRSRSVRTVSSHSHTRSTSKLSSHHFMMSASPSRDSGRSSVDSNTSRAGASSSSESASCARSKIFPVEARKQRNSRAATRLAGITTYANTPSARCVAKSQNPKAPMTKAIPGHQKIKTAVCKLEQHVDPGLNTENKVCTKNCLRNRQEALTSKSNTNCRFIARNPQSCWNHLKLKSNVNCGALCCQQGIVAPSKKVGSMFWRQNLMRCSHTAPLTTNTTRLIGTVETATSPQHAIALTRAVTHSNSKLRVPAVMTIL